MTIGPFYAEGFSFERSRRDASHAPLDLPACPIMTCNCHANVIIGRDEFHGIDWRVDRRKLGSGTGQHGNRFCPLRNPAPRLQSSRHRSGRLATDKTGCGKRSCPEKTACLACGAVAWRGKLHAADTIARLSAQLARLRAAVLRR
ncbi:hypothetical protein D3C72_1166930 [compost metagenome]